MKVIWGQIWWYETKFSVWKPLTKPTIEVSIVNKPTDNVKASIWWTSSKSKSVKSCLSYSFNKRLSWEIIKHNENVNTQLQNNTNKDIEEKLKYFIDMKASFFT